MKFKIILDPDLSQRMIPALHSIGNTIGHGDLIGQHIVNGSTKKHGCFPSGILCQIAPNSAGPGRGWIRRKNQVPGLCSILGILGNDPCFHLHTGKSQTIEVCLINYIRYMVEFFRINDHTGGGQGGCPSC